MSDIIVGNIYQINQNIPIPNGTLNKNTLVKVDVKNDTLSRPDR